MSVWPAPAQASPPSHPRPRVVDDAPSSRTWSGVEAAAERRRGRCSPGRSDKTHVEKAECEWRASLFLRGLRAPEHQPLLDKRKELHVKVIFIIDYFTIDMLII